LLYFVENHVTERIGLGCSSLGRNFVCGSYLYTKNLKKNPQKPKTFPQNLGFSSPAVGHV